jgi:hypothetical protein
MMPKPGGTHGVGSNSNVAIETSEARHGRGEGGAGGEAEGDATGTEETGEVEVGEPTILFKIFPWPTIPDNFGIHFLPCLLRREKQFLA